MGLSLSFFRWIIQREDDLRVCFSIFYMAKSRTAIRSLLMLLLAGSATLLITLTTAFEKGKEGCWSQQGVVFSSPSMGIKKEKNETKQYWTRLQFDVGSVRDNSLPCLSPSWETYSVPTVSVFAETDSAPQFEDTLSAILPNVQSQLHFWSIL